ncbi:MAG: flagellar basal-body rod protein FlgF [Hyphomicrobiales bacterium]|nr:MAG: flagellar basal-body rod protein FlgF [Hyphomicrobiales bacterium]
MENAQLISLSRQMALQRQMDVVANNLANINTTGFKGEQILFDQYLMPVARDKDFSYPDQPLHYVEDWATIHDMSNGAITLTGNPLDVALNGEGFLTVITPAGERYTRSGALQINNQGTLVDLDGNPVLADGGQIQFDESDTDITISPSGAISTNNGVKGRLQIVEFAAPEQLTRQGSNLYAAMPDAAFGPATATKVTQGAIERSNVSGVAEMTEMIRVSRAYESIANTMQKQDEMRRTAIQRLGEANG